MRLSEAIRLGSMLKPQGSGSDSIRSATTSCVLGAALDAIGVSIATRCDGNPYSIVQQQWPLLSLPVMNPAEDESQPMLDVLWRLNDWPHYWTREQIADWVESIEQQQEAPATVPASEVTA